VDEAKVLPEAASKMMQANQQLLQNFESMNALLATLANIRADADIVLPKIEKSMQETTAVMENSSKEMAETMRQTLEQTQKGINANFKTFDEQMQSELSKVIEQMGSQLTSLSGKFVEDYTPLTQQLQRMIQSLGRVQ
jgi:F0F1-type ATP synthase membrane subunit b/b'